MVRIKGHNPYKTTFEIIKWAVNKLDLFFFFPGISTSLLQRSSCGKTILVCEHAHLKIDLSLSMAESVEFKPTHCIIFSSAVVWVDFKLVLSMLHWLLLWFHWINLHRKIWGWIRWVKLREECSCINLIAVSSEIKILKTELSPPYPYAESYFVVSQITFF